MNENECIQFRTELKQLQAELICYSRLLADMATIENRNTIRRSRCGTRSS